jgi:hypothetical protein
MFAGMSNWNLEQRINFKLCVALGNTQAERVLCPLQHVAENL